MRIAFTGAHGVGKSTLIFHDIWKNSRLRDHKVVDSISRKYPKGWTDKKTQFFVNGNFIYNHYTNTNFISARSFYDPWAYSRLNVGLDFNFRLFRWAVKHINYDYLFYIPIEFNLEDDGFRPIDLDYQQAIDFEIFTMLEFFHTPYHTITGNIEERITQIKEITNLE